MNLDNLKYHAIIGALRAVAWLPLGVLYQFSNFARFVIHDLIGYRVKVVRKNLRNSFPEKSDKELREIEKGFYRHFCDVFIEAVKLLNISDRQLKKRVKIEGLDLVNEDGHHARSTILFLGHYGNWEWIPALTLHSDGSLLMGELYKPLRNKVMDRVMHRIRSRFSSVAIPHRSAFRTLLGYQRDNLKFIVGFIADQRPVGQPLHHWTTFLHQPTAFLAGGETIGDRIGARFLYGELTKPKRGHYILTFKKMETDPKDTAPYPYTRLFHAMLENSIRRQPEIWLWSHNKWKNPRPEDAPLLPAAVLQEPTSASSCRAD